MRDGCVLLLRCAFRKGNSAWMLPGGGREVEEEEFACVAREVLEETALTVRVERLLLDAPAVPPNNPYVRWRTFLCTVLSGEAVPGGGEGSDAELVDVMWLALADVATWPAEIVADAILAPQLLDLRAKL